jgi:uncharacterized repeat protein (TIGR03803 family)
MHTTRVTRTLALAGFAPAGKLGHLYGGLLPVLALFIATLGKLNWGKRAYAVLALCAATAIALPAQTFTTLFSFDLTDGANPYAGLVQATNGDLYGTTGLGGANRYGTVFKVTPSGALTTLYGFSFQNGLPGAGYPSEVLVQATNGDFYGTTSGGGANGYGTVFRVTPSGALTTLHIFCSQGPPCTDGEGPQAGLVQATDGDFYGTTSGGGADNLGTVYKISPTGTLTTLDRFASADGYYTSGLIQATDGDFYGTANGGGAHNVGTVFKITPSGTLTALYSFCSKGGGDCTDGEYPGGGLIQATNGDLYGTTADGGANGYGTVFKITPSGALTRLYSFCSQSGCPDGRTPVAGLLQDTNGTLYGITSYGGTSSACNLGCGTVFSLSVGLGPFVETQTTAGEVGEVVKILGNDLTGATSVTFNGTAAVFKVSASSLITTTVPAGATSGKVQVVLPRGTLSSNVPFRVLP